MSEDNSGRISVIKFEGDSSVLVWKHPSTDFLLPSMLVVHESQEAVFFRNGQALDTFGPGNYQLKTENLPLINKLINLPTDGKTPFHCEVYFINKADSMDFRWGTPNPMQIKDPIYNVILPVGASGQCTLRVNDGRKLLVKLVGTTNYLSHDEIRNYFKGILLSNIKEFISRQIIELKVSLLEINNHLTELSKRIKEKITDFFIDYGINLVTFNLVNVHIPDNDPSLKTIKDKMAEKAGMDIVGYTYQQERTYGVLDKAASNTGSGAAPIMGAGIGLGMGVNLGNQMGNMFGGAMSSINQPKFDSMIICPKCHTNLPIGAGFCFKCGTQIPKQQNENMVTCPNCGADVPDGAYCLRCGVKLKLTCPKCGLDDLKPDAVFCRRCGERIK